MRLRAAWRYTGVADGVVLSPVVSWAHDVKGWSADGLLNEGRRFAIFALKADFGRRYVAELGWTNTFGGTCNNARNRDFVSLSATTRARGLGLLPPPGLSGQNGACRTMNHRNRFP